MPPSSKLNPADLQAAAGGIQAWTGGLFVAGLVAIGVDEVATAERTPPVQAEAVGLAALREEGR